MKWKQLLVGLLAASTLAPQAKSDPCGMVPPIYLGQGPPITRVGVQQTYVFHKNGIETFVIRPGFSGKVDQFGMLIPFPSPPAIRKVADNVFPHLAAALDPPEVVVDLRVRRELFFLGAADESAPVASANLALKKDSVTVLSREAVGMYEVAVLEAGSAAALKLWMDEHGFHYPDGMDVACEEYVESGWCFVAVRARVGDKGATNPVPGMRAVDPSMGKDESFDGNVQAMGFRFHSEELVVPMRLSTFNEGDLHNIVYVLTDSPQRIRNIPTEFVVRQVPGEEIYRNLTGPLPLVVRGGTEADIPEWQRQGLPAQRDPRPHNGIARELFAGDLRAARTGDLFHPHEEREKILLDIGERLGLRGEDMDRMHAEILKSEREQLLAKDLRGLTGMTMTIIDGDFPREVLANENLRFERFAMAGSLNNRSEYDARKMGPGGTLGFPLPGNSGPGSMLALFAGFVALALLGIAASSTKRRMTLGVAGSSALCLIFLGSPATAELVAPEIPIEEPGPELNLPIETAAQAMAIAKHGPKVAKRLGQEALYGVSLVGRGWAIVALDSIEGAEATSALDSVQRGADNELVRTWAAAARIRRAASPELLASISGDFNSLPALARPLEARWTQFLAQGVGEEVVPFILQACANNGQLQQSLLPGLLKLGARPFVQASLTSTDIQTRNLAAGCLATLASQGETDIAGAVLSALRFDPVAIRVPWNGGPLFIPSLQWASDDARELAGSLGAWHLWCKERGRVEEQRQIHNNLRSVGLARAAGYSNPSWNPEDTDAWLLNLGRAFGRSWLERVLQRQRLDRDPHYTALLSKLSR